MTNHERALALVRCIASFANPDRHALRRSDGQGYSVVHHPLTDQKLVAHSDRKIALSVHPLIGDKSSIGVLDLDDHKKTMPWPDMARAGAKLIAELNGRGLRALAFRSGGGRGIHLFVLFREPQDAGLVRRMLVSVAGVCGYRSGSGGVDVGEVEVFPKQDHEGEKGGNPIALPLSRASQLLGPDFEDMNPEKFPDVGAMLNGPLAPSAYPPPPVKHSRPERGKVSIQTAEVLLRHVPAHDYDTWIKVGMIMRAEYGDDGFDPWVTWSETSENDAVKPAAFKSKWMSFGDGGRLGIGTLFFLAREHGWEPDSAVELADMNQRFGIVTRGNVTQIIDKLATYDPDTPLHLISVAVMKDRVRAEETSSNSKQDKGSAWMERPGRSHYHSVDFNPAQPPGDNGPIFNIWKGFNVDPAPGDWSLMQGFILDVIAGGDATKAQWLINWMARGIQFPADPIGTVPVLRGLPGTGKSFLANTYGYLWKPHETVVTHPDHVAGKFNGFTFGMRFVFIDEGFYGGDKAKAGVIKTRITERHVIIERKGVDPVRVPNRMIFMVASNEENVVPADVGDRRWMIFDVTDERKEDHAYFAAIQAQMESGGYAAMLYDLTHTDLSQGPDSRRIIPSKALFEQYMRNATAEVTYLHGVLDQGVLPRSTVAAPNQTCIAALHHQMKAREPNHRYVNDAVLAKKLKAMCGATPLKQDGTFTTAGETIRSKNYAFPPLAEARRRFQVATGFGIEWSDHVTEWQSENEKDVI